ncbi:MAG: hypothetical protein M3Z96_05465 [Pseudomonadota bacterium]|nr:hypothetical protein [Pseudomonadota bacterium]
MIGLESSSGLRIEKTHLPSILRQAQDEALFGKLKTKGLNLANTHLTNADKLSTAAAAHPNQKHGRRAGRCLPSAYPRCGKSSPPQIRPN